MRGDITIKGGAFVTAKSIEGEVILENVRGRVNANSTNQGITVNGATGEILAETVNGHISLNNVESPSVDASSVNGNIKYTEPRPPAAGIGFHPQRQHLSGVPESASATSPCAPTTGWCAPTSTAGGEARRGQRAVYTLGSGSAEFELESFGGTIQLRPAGATGP